MSEWINCNESLPENVHLTGVTIHTQCLAANQREGGAYFAVAVYDDADCIWRHKDSRRPMNAVTHWMPIPEPPKEVV